MKNIFRTKRPFKLTGPGWVFILYTIGIGAGAINTGNNLLYLVFGVFLGLLLASGFLSDLSLWGVRASLTFPHSGQAGEPQSIFLTVSNNKRWFPAISVNVIVEGNLRGMPVHLKTHIPYVSAQGSLPARVEWTPQTRGGFKMTNLRLSTRYPFGLLEKWWRLSENEQPGEMFIIPSPHSIAISQLSHVITGEERPSENIKRGDSATLMGLRAYVAGDNPRKIHWKASAKRGATAMNEMPWLVREMNQEEKESLILECPSPEELRHESGDQIEKLVTFLASFVHACKQYGVTPRISLGGDTVADESAFFALWEPKLEVPAALKSFLRSASFSISPEPRLNMLEAFRAWKPD